MAVEGSWRRDEQEQGQPDERETPDVARVCSGVRRVGSSGFVVVSSRAILLQLVCVGALQRLAVSVNAGKGDGANKQREEGEGRKVVVAKRKSLESNATREGKDWKERGKRGSRAG